jgi:hypothetical protein
MFRIHNMPLLRSLLFYDCALAINIPAPTELKTFVRPYLELNFYYFRFCLLHQPQAFFLLKMLHAW